MSNGRRALLTLRLPVAVMPGIDLAWPYVRDRRVVPSQTPQQPDEASPEA